MLTFLFQGDAAPSFPYYMEALMHNAGARETGHDSIPKEKSQESRTELRRLAQLIGGDGYKQVVSVVLLVLALFDVITELRKREGLSGRC